MADKDAPSGALSTLKPDALMRTLKQQFELDRRHSADWRKKAREAYAFVAGHGQWTEDERRYLESAEGGKRVPITFNRSATIIEAVCGLEINSRHDTIYMPRGQTPGAAYKNELLSSASQWMTEESDADSEQSQAFRDSVITGMGWTEHSLSYDEELDGKYVESRIDPLEMYWDHKSRKSNLKDARRVWHVRSNVDLAEARAMFPGIADEDLDATWATEAESSDGKSLEEKRDRSDENSESMEDNTVTIVRVQWWEHETVTRAQIDGQIVEIDAERLKMLQAIAAQSNLPPPKAVRQKRKRYMQAFLGAEILRGPEPAPCPHVFSFQCITGRMDESKGEFYGLVALLHDPQKWANKWLTQSLHILNSTAKGGYFAEAGAFPDPREAERTIASPHAVTEVAKGALADGRIKEKAQAGFAQGHMQLMEFALAAIRDASGINMELLGLRDANQPGVLEAQRKQAGMTILATLFDSMRYFRKQVGIGRLYLIQEFFADGRLVRLNGPDGAQYVQLAKDKVAGRYDIIVEDAPTSANQREQTWALMQPLLAMFKDTISPPVLMEVLEFSPLPPSVVERIKKAMSAPNPEQQQQQQLGQRAQLAKIAVDEATALQKQTDAKATMIEAGVTVADAEHNRMNPPSRDVPQRPAPRVNGTFRGPPG